jgi:hypothetical protein
MIRRLDIWFKHEPYESMKCDIIHIKKALFFENR